MLRIASARACGQEDIVLTGKLTRIFRFMQEMKRLEFVFGRGFVIPEHADYATAIGAARTPARCSSREIPAIRANFSWEAPFALAPPFQPSPSCVIDAAVGARRFARART